jgi:Mg-chelatase subunit ChlD
MRTVFAVLSGFFVSVLALAVLLLPGSPVCGQQGGAAPFDLVQGKVETLTVAGVKKLRVYYTITPKPGFTDADRQGYEIVFYEKVGSGQFQEVKRMPLPQTKKVEGLSAVLAFDISGSMNDPLPGSMVPRIQQARKATDVFFERLPKTAEAGLILFNHQLYTDGKLTLDRQVLKQRIANAKPHGGTAYLDAVVEGVRMLRPYANKKVVVVITDGVDLNSRASLGQAIRQAKAAGVNVYTVGIGEPGRQVPMTSVLVLDHSGSMRDPASNQDRDKAGNPIPKIEALKEAAALFINFVRPGLARTTLLEFSDTPAVPQPFTSDRMALQRIIMGLKPSGETALFDAVYDAIEAIEAAQPQGKAAIVALTDGIDNSSRRRVEEVIARAKQVRIQPFKKEKPQIGIPLYMLGFGREGELDEKVMKKMAEETGGEYFPARNKNKLLDIFEKLSNRLHDDGINEADLQKLASETGGQYYHVKDVSNMKFIVEQLVVALKEKADHKDIDDIDQRDDGLIREVRLALARGRETVSQTKGQRSATHGLVVPEMNAFVYLGLLSLIGLLIALPAGLRRLARAGG